MMFTICAFLGITFRGIEGILKFKPENKSKEVLYTGEWYVFKDENNPANLLFIFITEEAKNIFTNPEIKLVHNRWAKCFHIKPNLNKFYALDYIPDEIKKLYSEKHNIYFLTQQNFSSGTIKFVKPDSDFKAIEPEISSFNSDDITDMIFFTVVNKICQVYLGDRWDDIYKGPPYYKKRLICASSIYPRSFNKVLIGISGRWGDLFKGGISGVMIKIGNLGMMEYSEKLSLWYLNPFIREFRASKLNSKNLEKVNLKNAALKFIAKTSHFLRIDFAYADVRDNPSAFNFTASPASFEGIKETLKLFWLEYLKEHIYEVLKNHIKLLEMMTSAGYLERNEFDAIKQKLTSDNKLDKPIALEIAALVVYVLTKSAQTGNEIPNVDIFLLYLAEILKSWVKQI